MERAELRRIAREVPGAVEQAGFVFLCDPAWGRQEVEAARRLLDQAGAADASAGWLCIPTGGSSGEIRFARHDERSIGAAVRGFQRHFGVEAISAVGVLPLHHVSGFMARARCLATGGTYVQGQWSSLARGEGGIPHLGGDAFLSLVPTQLQRLLSAPGGPAALRRFRMVFVGGGPVWSALASDAAAAEVPVSLTYGMTETAAMVAAQEPQDFLRGARNVGRPMPHARIDTAPGAEGEPAGVLRIRTASLFRGYFPDFQPVDAFVTADLGFFEPDGCLRIVGRKDGAIISGGEKVWPAEVEEALRRTGAFTDVAVLGVPDSQWGEAVVAFHEGEVAGGEIERVRTQLEQTLAPYKQPKRYVPVSPWPRNAQGKVSRRELLSAALGS